MKYSFMRHWWRDVDYNIPYYDYHMRYCYNGSCYKDWLEREATPCSGLGKCEEYCDDEDFDECEIRLDNLRRMQEGAM